MSSKTTTKLYSSKMSSTKSVETERKGGLPEAALLTPSNIDLDIEKSGSHAQSAATFAVQEDGGVTPDSVKLRKLAHIKKRVSQEFQSSPCQKFGIWLVHLLAATLPWVAILIGVIYRNDCPAEPKIPVNLIVLGVTCVIVHLSVCIDLHRRLPYLKSKEKPAIYTFLAIFLLVWLILGLVWTFGIFIPEPDWGTMIREEASQFYYPKYCHHTIYWCALYSNIVGIVVLVIACTLCCFVCPLLCNMGIVTCLCRDRPGDNDGASTPINV